MGCWPWKYSATYYFLTNIINFFFEDPPLHFPSSHDLLLLFCLITQYLTNKWLLLYKIYCGHTLIFPCTMLLPFITISNICDNFNNPYFCICNTMLSFICHPFKVLKSLAIIIAHFYSVLWNIGIKKSAFTFAPQNVMPVWYTDRIIGSHTSK